MRITQELVAKVKRYNKLELHPQSWWDFQALPEVQAINTALDYYRSESMMYITNGDIVDKAKEILKSNGN